MALGAAPKGVVLSLGGSNHDPTDPVGRLLFNVLGMVAEFEADLIRMRTREGMAVAKAKGRLKGKHGADDWFGGPLPALAGAGPCLPALLQEEALRLASSRAREALVRYEIGVRLFDEARYRDAAAELEWAYDLYRAAGRERIARLACGRLNGHGRSWPCPGSLTTRPSEAVGPPPPGMFCGRRSLP